MEPGAEELEVLRDDADAAAQAQQRRPAQALQVATEQGAGAGAQGQVAEQRGDQAAAAGPGGSGDQQDLAAADREVGTQEQRRATAGVAGDRRRTGRSLSRLPDGDRVTGMIAGRRPMRR